MPTSSPARSSRPAKRSASSARPGDATGPHLHLQLQPPTAWPQQDRLVPILRRQGVHLVGRRPLANSRALSFVALGRGRRRSGRAPVFQVVSPAGLRRPPSSTSAAQQELRYGAQFADKKSDGPQAACPSAPSGVFRAARTRRNGDLDLCRGTPARLDASRLDHGRSGTAARRPRRAQSGLRLRERNARGRRVRVARPRLRARLRREYRCRAVSGGRHARSRYGRTAHHTDLEAQLGLFADR